MKDFPTYPVHLKLTISVGTGPEAMWWEANLKTDVPEIPKRGGLLLLGELPRVVVADSPILGEYSESAVWDVKAQAYRVPILLATSSYLNFHDEEERTQVLETLRESGWQIIDRMTDAPEDDR